MKSETELKVDGFTESGITRYRKTAEDYTKKLHDKCIVFGERDKASGMMREITHEHVREAAVELQRKSRESDSKLQVFCKIGEYLCTAFGGAAAGNLDKSVGILAFGICITLGIILFVARNQVSRFA